MVKYTIKKNVKDIKRNGKSKNGNRKGTVQMSAQLPIAISSPMRYRNPRIVSINEKTIVRHRELTVDVQGAAAGSFTVANLYLNPGNQVMFPWLSKIAENFERYNFRKLKLKYIPSCPTTSTGQVGFCFDYDLTDPVPTSIKAFTINKDAKIGQVYAPLVAVFSTKDINGVAKSYYVSQDTSSINTKDPKLSFPARLFAMTNGFQTDYFKAGQLWVDYEVEFTLPSVNTLIPGADRSIKASVLSVKSNKLNFFGQEPQVEIPDLDTDSLPLGFVRNSPQKPPGWASIPKALYCANGDIAYECEIKVNRNGDAGIVFADTTVSGNFSVYGAGLLVKIASDFVTATQESLTTWITWWSNGKKTEEYTYFAPFITAAMGTLVSSSLAVINVKIQPSFAANRPPTGGSKNLYRTNELKDIRGNGADVIYDLN